MGISIMTNLSGQDGHQYYDKPIRKDGQGRMGISIMTKSQTHQGRKGISIMTNLSGKDGHQYYDKPIRAGWASVL